MKWLKSILVTLGTMILGMMGGQGKLGGKGTRRFGIFGFALTIDGFHKRAFPLVFLIPTLVMGYGENSWLYDKLGMDWLVRLVYSALLSLCFLFYGWRRWLVAFLCLCGAFQIHAGSLGHASWFGDFLIEDIVRYTVLGILISFNLFITRDV